jgi:hypothetical protein
MTFATLVTTYQKSERELSSLVEANHLEGQVLIGNQCGKEDIKELGNVGQATVTVYSFASHGVSINRNSLLAHCEADIVTFSDDDLVFTPGYSKEVLSFFEAHPEAELLHENVSSGNQDRPIIPVTEEKRIRFKDVSKYGVVGFFFSRKFLLQNHLVFNPKLGPGQPLSHGEDTVFLKDVFRAKATGYQKPKVIAFTSMDTSSWYGQDIENDIVTDGYCYQLTRGALAFLYGVHRYYAHRNYYPGYSLKKFLKPFKKGRKLAKIDRKSQSE